MSPPDSDTVNAIAGVAALVNSLILVPSVMALRKIAAHLDTRVTKLEGRKAKPKRRAR